MQTIQWLKIIGAIGCLLLSMVSGFLSRHKIFHNHPSFLGMINMAGGGIIFAVALSHLLPEMQEGFSTVDTDYPIGYLLVMIGYIVIVILEKVLFRHHGHGKRQSINDEQVLDESRPHAEDRLLSKPEKANLITPIMLLITLSIHSLLEGLVWGLQQTVAGTVSFMIAVVSHKPLETLLLGIVLVKEHVRLTIHIVFIGILSAVTPVGMCIGLNLDHLEISDAVMAGFNAMAAGSFIYIATTEIIGEEFQSCNSPSERWQKLFFLILGGGIIFGLEAVLGHTHES